jgi:hypothetical protein
MNTKRLEHNRVRNHITSLKFGSLIDKLPPPPPLLMWAIEEINAYSGVNGKMGSTNLPTYPRIEYAIPHNAKANLTV